MSGARPDRPGRPIEAVRKALAQTSDEQRELFVRMHGDILAPEFWRNVQEKVAAGEMMEVLPYHPHRVRVASSS